MIHPMSCRVRFIFLPFVYLFSDIPDILENSNFARSSCTKTDGQLAGKIACIKNMIFNIRKVRFHKLRSSWQKYGKFP